MIEININIDDCFFLFNLFFNRALKQGGLVGGSIGILLLGIMSFYTLYILTRTGHITHQLTYHNINGKNSPTYPEIGYRAFGKIGEYIVWFGVLCMTIGVCGSYIVFIGTSLSQLLTS